ncbi:protein phosphatase 2C [Angomonas deanei]|uniref:Protein phosphatase n=1 Tax=Angomonas deanei TaxID=59799 RepID=S9V9J0_9TRYP|nr:protein phosphatase 2C [Angomonas deanei]EPY37982.1 protein phosphatase 2C [Angomonas deanei]CAD2215495.1 Stage II sporulation protein E (SpoIIE), putative [Angomonas deanei]|eukprot:EPY37674.1 protein phosphatase 2C [Angomonas deanei]
MFRNRATVLGRRLSFTFRKVSFIPHPDKVETGGEDAFLSLSNVQAVLDGVSWWRDNAGVNAGLYSAAMARSMNDYVEEELLGDTPASSFRLLERAYEDCKHSEVQGTATALVATLQEPSEEIQRKDGYHLVQLETEGNSFYADVENNLLDVISVGDCTLMLIRRGKILYTSEEQDHAMDFPFQLGTGSADKPSDGNKVLIPVQPGDVVVMGSDGVFDNIYAEKLASVLWKPIDKVYNEFQYFHESSSGKPGLATAASRNANLRNRLTDQLMAAIDEGMAEGMEEAVSVSKDIRGDSPYATKCIENGALYEGGKPDDMTLLVSIISIADDETSGERFSSSEVAFPPPYRDWP